MNNQELWTGEFGDAYTKRNRSLDTQARYRMWEMLLPKNLESVLEVGANNGQNLEAIARLSDCDLYAAEPNELAREELIATDILPARNVTADFADKITFPDKFADLVITSGLLIHIDPGKLLPSMREIYRCSRRWIISAEYFAPLEEMVPYRGHQNALWRRDYGSLWLDNFPDLHCHAAVFAWKRMTGLDNLTFWVLEKGRAKH